jgi:hypothetical protein
MKTYPIINEEQGRDPFAFEAAGGAYVYVSANNERRGRA